MATRRQARPAPSNRWGPLPPHAVVRSPFAVLWRLLERALLVLAVLSLGYYTYVSAEAMLYQAFENQELDRILTGSDHRTSRTTSPVAPQRPRPATARRGSAIGRIEIPRLHVSAVIRAGTDARTLRLAVGHISGTALPGQTGNMGVAGHRDTFFRRLRDIRQDDEIRVATPGGVYTYRVSGMRIVDPTDLSVLDPTTQASLTLVTCYPFSYIGSAPRRFIVRAELARPAAAPQRVLPAS
jgi:sortase A